MFIQGKQGRKAIGLAIMSNTVSYLFSMIYILPYFKPVTSWNKKNKIGQTIRIKFTLAFHLYSELCVCLSM